MAKNILVVDDHKESADTKVFVIKKLGGDEFSAEAVYGGQECLDRLKKEPPVDLILLDLEMPVVNGKDVILELMKGGHRPIKVLIMTAWGPDWVSHWEMQAMADTPEFKNIVWSNTFDKATDSQQLMEMLRGALGISEG